MEERRKLFELQIKLNNKEKLILEQRNIVLEKQIRIEELEHQLKEITKRIVEPHQEFLNENIKVTVEVEKPKLIIQEKEECGECRREDRRMYPTKGYKCENDYCCNYK
jgi:uncharacterized coiled-coil protein SlyX